MTNTRHPERFEENRFPSLRDTMRQLFEESFWDPFTAIDRAGNGIAFPRVDVSEDENNVYVTANVPGVNPDDLEVEANENVLTISGETKREDSEEDKERNYYRYEREYGTFRRSVRLPSSVVGDQAKAKAKNGVVEITLPKSKDERQNKIKIETE